VRIFLLSPAHCGGRRATFLLRESAASPLARPLRADGAALGEVFAFLSGLYFRGKLAYAERFGRAPEGVGGVHVITPTRGLKPPGTRITAACLEEFAAVDVQSGEARYRDPLAHDAGLLARTIGPAAEVVLLGSIATNKYTDVLLEAFGPRLHFPADFVGRGDMSRGALMLHAVRIGSELAYRPVQGAVRTGRRAPPASADALAPAGTRRADV
jgi:hypothetical protein